MKALRASRAYLKLLSAPSVPREAVTLPESALFAFFDQVSCTGVDLKQAPDACAAITVSKDTSFRDYAQAAFRMRGLGLGQTMAVLLVPEVEQLVHECCTQEPAVKGVVDALYGGQGGGAGAAATRTPHAGELVLYLLANSVRSEGMQHAALQKQRLAHLVRIPARLESRVRDSARRELAVPPWEAPGSGAAGGSASGETVAGAGAGSAPADASLAGIDDLFLINTHIEALNSGISFGTARAPSYGHNLDKMFAAFSRVLQGDARALAEAQDILRAVHAEEARILAAEREAVRSGRVAVVGGMGVAGEYEATQESEKDAEKQAEKQKDKRAEHELENEEETDAGALLNRFSVTPWCLAELLRPAIAFPTQQRDTARWLPVGMFAKEPLPHAAGEVAAAPAPHFVPSVGGTAAGPLLLATGNHTRGLFPYLSPAQTLQGYTLPAESRQRRVFFLLTVRLEPAAHPADPSRPTPSSSRGAGSSSSSSSSSSAGLGIVVELREANTLCAVIRRLALGERVGGKASAGCAHLHMSLFSSDTEAGLGAGAGGVGESCLASVCLPVPAYVVTRLRQGISGAPGLPSSHPAFDAVHADRYLEGTGGGGAAPLPTPLFLTPNPSATALVACARLFDSSTRFTRDELWALFSTWGPLHPSAREARYYELSGLRKRSAKSEKLTGSVRLLFRLASLDEFSTLSAGVAAVNQALHAFYGPSLLRTFTALTQTPPIRPEAARAWYTGAAAPPAPLASASASAAEPAAPPAGTTFHSASSNSTLVLRPVIREALAVSQAFRKALGAALAAHFPAPDTLAPLKAACAGGDSDPMHHARDTVTAWLESTLGRAFAMAGSVALGASSAGAGAGAGAGAALVLTLGFTFSEVALVLSAFAPPAEPSSSSSSSSVGSRGPLPGPSGPLVRRSRLGGSASLGGGYTPFSGGVGGVGSLGAAGSLAAPSQQLISAGLQRHSGTSGASTDHTVLSSSLHRNNMRSFAAAARGVNSAAASFTAAIVERAVSGMPPAGRFLPYCLTGSATAGGAGGAAGALAQQLGESGGGSVCGVDCSIGEDGRLTLFPLARPSFVECAAPAMHGCIGLMPSGCYCEIEEGGGGGAPGLGFAVALEQATLSGLDPPPPPPAALVAQRRPILALGVSSVRYKAGIPGGKDLELYRALAQDGQAGGQAGGQRPPPHSAMGGEGVSLAVFEGWGGSAGEEGRPLKRILGEWALVCQGEVRFLGLPACHGDVASCLLLPIGATPTPSAAGVFSVGFAVTRECGRTLPLGFPAPLVRSSFCLHAPSLEGSAAAPQPSSSAPSPFDLSAQGAGVWEAPQPPSSILPATQGALTASARLAPIVWTQPLDGVQAIVPRIFTAPRHASSSSPALVDSGPVFLAACAAAADAHSRSAAAPAAMPAPPPAQLALPPSFWVSHWAPILRTRAIFKACEGLALFKKPAPSAIVMLPATPAGIAALCAAAAGLKVYRLTPKNFALVTGAAAARAPKPECGSSEGAEGAAAAGAVGGGAEATSAPTSAGLPQVQRGVLLSELVVSTAGAGESDGGKDGQAPSQVLAADLPQYNPARPSVVHPPASIMLECSRPLPPSARAYFEITPLLPPEEYTSSLRLILSLSPPPPQHLSWGGFKASSMDLASKGDAIPPSRTPTAITQRLQRVWGCQSSGQVVLGADTSRWQVRQQSSAQLKAAGRFSGGEQLGVLLDLPGGLVSVVRVQDGSVVSTCPLPPHFAVSGPVFFSLHLSAQCRSKAEPAAPSAGTAPPLPAVTFSTHSSQAAKANLAPSAIAIIKHSTQALVLARVGAAAVGGGGGGGGPAPTPWLHCPGRPAPVQHAHAKVHPATGQQYWRQWGSSSCCCCCCCGRALPCHHLPAHFPLNPPLQHSSSAEGPHSAEAAAACPGAGIPHALP